MPLTALDPITALLVIDLQKGIVSLPTADAHANSIARIFPRLGEVGTTQEIIDLLDRARD